MYCKYILGLKKSTPNCIIYKELGRYPVEIRIKTSIIAYWSRLVTCQKQNKLTSLLYKTLYQLHTANIFHSKWLENVQAILNECGMTNVWQDQSEGISTHWLKCAIKNRLQDQFVQEADRLSNNNSNCLLYRNIKQNHKFETFSKSTKVFLCSNLKTKKL